MPNLFIHPTSTPDMVREKVGLLFRSMEADPNFVLSNSCNLPENVSLENIEAFMQTGRKYRIS